MRVLLVILFLISFAASADPVTVSRVVSVYDGDTFRVDIDDWPEIVGRSMPIRVRGIDAPEIRTRCDAERVAAIASRDFVRGLLASADSVVIRNIQRGKYFRIIADVEFDGQSCGRAFSSLRRRNQAKLVRLIGIMKIQSSFF